MSLSDRTLDPIARPAPIGFTDENMVRQRDGPPPLPSPSHSILDRLLPSLPGTVTDSTDFTEDARNHASLSSWLVNPPTVGLGSTHDVRSKQHLHTAAFSDAAANADRPSSALLYAAHETLETFYRLKDHDFRGGAHSPEILSLSSAAPIRNDNFARSASPNLASVTSTGHLAAHRLDEPIAAAPSFPQIHASSNLGQNEASVAPPQHAPVHSHHAAKSKLRAEEGLQPPRDPHPPGPTHAAVNEQFGQIPQWQPPFYHHTYPPMPSFPFAHPSYHPSMPQSFGAFPHAGGVMHWPAMPAGYLHATSPSAAPEMSSIFTLLASHPHLWYDANFQRTLATIAGAASVGGPAGAETRGASSLGSAESSDVSTTQGTAHVAPKSLAHPPNSHASPIDALGTAIVASSAKSASLRFARQSVSQATASEVHARFCLSSCRTVLHTP
jgi:hypothetical protein